jgi:hypothetical protein
MSRVSSRINQLLLVVTTVAAIASFGLLALSPEGHGAEAHHLVQTHIEEDAFLNYDFTSMDHSSHHVDWAISLLFWNNSSVNGVKDALDDQFHPTGSTMNAYLNNGAGWHWDTDKGRKEVQCIAVGDSVHYRIYGPPSDHFYNERWGFFNIASVHIDHNECNFIDKWSGESEKAEGIVADVFASTYDSSFVKEDWVNFENIQKTEVEGDHHWENDAFGTKLKMPARNYEGGGGAS